MQPKNNSSDNHNDKLAVRNSADKNSTDQTAYEAVSGPPTSLFEYWHLFMKRKGTLLIAAVLGTCLGLLISLPRTPIYQARTTLEILGLNDNLLNTREVNPASPSVSTTAFEQIQTQIRLLQSESLIRQVVGKMGVTGSLPQPTRLTKWRSALGLTETQGTSSREAAVAMAAQNLWVEAVPQSHIIRIVSDSSDPQVAAEFLNNLADEFINQKLESRVDNNERTSEWLTRQLDDLKVNLERSEDKLLGYGRNAGLMFTSESDGSVAEQKLQQLQTELSNAQADRVIKQSRYEIASTASPESLPQVLDDPSMGGFQSKLAEMRSQLAELNVSLTPEHYRVQRLQAQINELQSTFERERDNIVKRITNEYEDARRREELLSEEYGAQVRLVSDQADKLTHYGILKREVETSRQLYEAMMQRVKEYGIASAVTANNVRVVDRANAPAAPYKPDIYMHTGLGLMTGLFLGLLLVIRRERTDRSIHAPGEAPAYLNVPELGVVPAFADENTAESANRPARIPALQSLAELSKRIANSDLARMVASTPRETKETPAPGLELVTWQKPFSPVAESFRAIAASVLFTERNGSQPHVLVVTSSNPQDGKSTTASNLAVALSETKRRILLIDADLRRSDLHRVFHLENRWGLTDVLEGDIDVNEYPLDVLVRQTAVPNVYVLNAGTNSSAAIHLLHSTRLPDLIQRLRREFDIVLIDSPPALQIADARVLARVSDGVIFVIRARRTTRDMAKAACRRFQEDRTTIIGTVLNMWNPQDPGQQQYYYYNSYYDHYGQKESVKPASVE
jgi:capsular exopolysaccharide synthesis family protein